MQQRKDSRWQRPVTVARSASRPAGCGARKAARVPGSGLLYSEPRGGAPRSTELTDNRGHPLQGQSLLDTKLIDT